MSGSNPLVSGPPFQGGNALMAPQQPAAPQAPPPQLAQFGVHHAAAALADTNQSEMIRKRDGAGREMAELAKVANDPDPNRAEIVVYINKLITKGQVKPQEAAQILQALPNDSAGIRQWARVAFNALMHVGIHAHAAYPASVFPADTQDAAQPAQPEQPDPASETVP